MPLSFSNIKDKVQSSAIPAALNAVIPGGGVIYNAASQALKNKTSPQSIPLAPIASASAPIPAPTTMPTQSRVDSSTLALQKQLNSQNAGKTGWVPLKEDGILGPKTKAATTWQPVTAAPYTPPSAAAPAGGEASAGKKKTETQPQQPVQSYPGIIGQLLKKIEEEASGYTKQLADSTKRNQGYADRARDISDAAGKTITDIGRKGAAAAAGYLSTGTSPVGEGNAAIQQQTAAAQQQAAAQGAQMQLAGVDRELTAQQQAQTGLGTAAERELAAKAQELAALEGAGGLAQGVQIPYSNQYIDPQTGLPIGGGAAGGTLQNAVASIAEKVKNGTMGYDAGVAALQGYGQAGVNELQKALGANFNIQQSNATAAAQEASTLQTGTVGGQLSKQAETVKSHMVTLEQAYKQLTAQAGIPAANAIVNWFGRQTGSAPLQSYQIALTNVRDELAKILGGGTSTDSSRATAEALLPDNMTPAQLTASIKTATELMNSKIAEYTRTPEFNNNQAAGSGAGLYDW